MNILWLTDIHLDYLLSRERRNFLQSLVPWQPDIVLVGGDTSKASSLKNDLRAIQEATNTAVYFVLGNHDYFGSSFSDVHDLIGKLTKEENDLYWLENMSHVELMEGVALVGHGCWGDAGAGSYWKSVLNKEMPDFREIEDLKVLNRHDRLLLLKKLGNDASEFIKKSCLAAVKFNRQVIILTHVPPFPQSIPYDEKSNETGLPFFCCLAAGNALREVAKVNPNVQFTVLSGHTHRESRIRLLENLEAIVQGAEYRMPVSKELRF